MWKVLIGSSLWQAHGKIRHFFLRKYKIKVSYFSFHSTTDTQVELFFIFKCEYGYDQNDVCLYVVYCKVQTGKMFVNNVDNKTIILGQLTLKFITWTHCKSSLGHYCRICKMTGNCLHNIHSLFLSFFQKEPPVLFNWSPHTTWLRGEQTLISTSQNGPDPFIMTVVIPHLWHAARPRNKDVCWKAPGGGLLLPGRAASEHWGAGVGPGPLQPACCQSEQETYTVWTPNPNWRTSGILTYHTQGTVSEILTWDNKCPYLSQLEAVWGRVFC